MTLLWNLMRPIRAECFERCEVSLVFLMRVGKDVAVSLLALSEYLDGVRQRCLTRLHQALKARLKRVERFGGELRDGGSAL